MATLEEELKNTKPLALRPRALLNILYTASWLDCILHRRLRPFGLTHPQYNILRILNGSFPKGLSVLDIKDRMIDRNSNVSRLVEKLRERQLVDRLAHEGDRRMVVVSISAAGQQILKDIEQEGFLKAAEMPGNQLTDQEIANLGELLDRFRE
jgi:MarR family transcriptional regulator, 2-MHQ and catechol-resistance regulon repressor